MSRSCRPLALTMALLAASALGRAAGAETATVSVHTDKVANTIDPHVYGHFFEHIYHSANGGLWGEAVFNRSFEQRTEGQAGWYHEGETIFYEGSQPQARLIGGQEWRDGEYRVEACRVEGDAPLRVFFRFKGQAGFVLTLGAQENTAFTIDRISGSRRAAASAPAASAEPLVKTAGVLESKRWYKIRVRMEGSSVQAWVDDKLVGKAEMGRTPAQGYIGVGAGSKAQFRSFKVMGLDGQEYWNRLLPAAQKNAVAERWSVFGGEGQILGEGALNDAMYLQVKAEEGESIVQQEDFTLKAGDAMTGSLWLKGRAPAGATVQFVQGQRVLASAKVPAVSETWKEYPIRLASAADARGAALRIVFEGPVEVGIDQVSLMADSARRNGGFRPDLYEAFAGLKPTVMRWPGGCYAEQYKWKNGIGPQSARKKSLTPWWEDYDPNALGTDEYLALCKKIGSDPLLVINTGMHVTGTSNEEQWKPWVEEACQWVEYCNGPANSEWGKRRAANGHPEPYNVKLWEIDNELWRSRQRSPAVYAQAVKLFSAAMKKVDPSITIIAHGGNGTDQRYNTTVVNDAAEAFDVLSIHHYTSPERFALGVRDQDSLYTDTIKLLAGSRNPKAKIYVSEWNAQTTDWRTGLYAGGLLNVFERHGETLTMAGPALMAREVTAHEWDNAFINFDRNGWFPGPNYVVMKLWRDHYAPQRLEAETASEGLNLVATKTAAGNEVIFKAVNPTAEPLEVTATLEGAFRVGGAKMQVVAPGSLMARNSMAKPDAIRPVEAPASVNGQQVQFTLPAYSAGVVRLQAR